MVDARVALSVGYWGTQKVARKAARMVASMAEKTDVRWAVPTVANWAETKAAAKVALMVEQKVENSVLRLAVLMAVTMAD